MVQIRDNLEIPDDELRYTTSRSSGPGGQNVNKVETRVTLHFDLEGSGALSDVQRARIRAKLGTRINKEGVLQLSSQDNRTQGANRQAVTERFAKLLREALAPRRKRVPTRKSKAAEARRLEAKCRQSRQKSLRRKPVTDSE